jgi:hypothetical protein
MAADLEAPSARYVRRSDTAPPVPGRTRTPDIGAACHETRKVAGKPATTEENRRGVDIGTPRGSSLIAKQEAMDAARRRGRSS